MALLVLNLGTLRKLDQKYLQRFEVWGWRRIREDQLGAIA